MKVTGLSPQVRDKNRVNVMIDGKYRFSLDVAQVIDLGIKIGKEYSDDELAELESESIFGKLYNRTLEYTLVRPRSEKEVKDYLYRKTLDKRTSTGGVKPGVPVSVTERVFQRLVDRGYVDDLKFAQYWLENRRLKKGASTRLLRSELSSKGVSSSDIERAMESFDRSDQEEILKVIARKKRLYSDEKKLIAYLARQGFSYDDIKNALEAQDD
jgi:regulatory protein